MIYWWCLLIDLFSVDWCIIIQIIKMNTILKYKFTYNILVIFFQVWDTLLCLLSLFPHLPMPVLWQIVKWCQGVCFPLEQRVCQIRQDGMWCCSPSYVKVPHIQYRSDYHFVSYRNWWWKTIIRISLVN